MLYKVFEGHPDGKIFKDNIINIAKWIKKEKKLIILIKNLIMI